MGSRWGLLLLTLMSVEQRIRTVVRERKLSAPVSWLGVALQWWSASLWIRGASQ